MANRAWGESSFSRTFEGPGRMLSAATAAHHGLTVLHDDADYRAIARHAPDLTEHNVHDIA